MPYSSTSELPDQAKSLSAKQKRAFKEAFNSAYKEHGEKSAFKIAWAAAKRAGGEVDKHDEFFEHNAKLGPWLESELHRHFTVLADRMYGDGKITRDERIALSSAIGDALGKYVKTVERKAPRVNEIRKLRWSTPDGLATLVKINPEYVAKHLIGHHEQKDHDPTKSGHSRAQHKEMARPNLERAGLMGTLGALSGAMALKKGSTPLTRGLYGLYALNFAIGTADAIAQARSVSKAKDEALGDVLEKLSRVSGVRPEQLLEDLGEYMMSNKIVKPTTDDIHEFMIESYGHDIAKHLIGGHRQKDHDPTKGGHSRSKHNELARKMNRGSKAAAKEYYPQGELQGTLTDVGALSLATTGAVMAPGVARAGRKWHQTARYGGRTGMDYPIPVKQQTLRNIKETRQQVQGAVQNSLEEARQRFQQYMSGAGKTTVTTNNPINTVWAGTGPSPFLPARRL